MHEPTYQQALSHACELAWKHKTLWALGLLSAVVAQFGLGDFFGRLLFLYQQGGVGLMSSSILNNFSWIMPSAMSWATILGFIWLTGLVILLTITIIFITITAQGALISYASNYFKNKNFDNLTKAWNKSIGHFWQLLKINILYKLLFCAILLSSASVIKVWVLAETTLLQIILGFVLGLLLFVYLVFSIVYFYVIAYVVVDNQLLPIAAKKAWNLFDRHVLVSIEIGLLMMLLNLLLIIAGSTALLLAFLPSLVLWIVAGIFGFTGLASLGLGLGLLLWLIIILIMVAVFNVFNTSAWVYLFIKMHKEGVVSRVVYHIGKVFKK